MIFLKLLIPNQIFFRSVSSHITLFDSCYVQSCYANCVQFRNIRVNVPSITTLHITTKVDFLNIKVNFNTLSHYLSTVTTENNAMTLKILQG